MFLLMVIVILIAATSILANIYGGIFSFQQNYGDLENYTNSHYAAISAIERGLLVTKYKNPNFVGSGGFIGTGNRGEISDLFSGAFGKYNQNTNGLYRTINSQCNNEIGILNNHQVLVFQTYTYNNTAAYTGNNAISTKGISQEGILTGILKNINNTININNGNIYRQINGDNEIVNNTGFVASSGNTMINYGAINNEFNITFNNTTINPLSTIDTGDILCTQNGCYTGQSIGNLIASNEDKGIILYIQDRLTHNDQQIGSVQYNLTNNFSGNCQNYYIDGTAIIGKYKQELSIEKPTFNYRNPNRKQFIFPHYN